MCRCARDLAVQRCVLNEHFLRAQVLRREEAEAGAQRTFLEGKGRVKWRQGWEVGRRGKEGRGGGRGNGRNSLSERHSKLNEQPQVRTLKY